MIRMSALCSGLVVAGAVHYQAPTEMDSGFEIPANEKPFWDSAKQFLNHHARRDAEGLGNLFTEDAEFFDEFGELTQGGARPSSQH